MPRAPKGPGSVLCQPSCPTGNKCIKHKITIKRNFLSKILLLILMAYMFGIVFSENWPRSLGLPYIWILNKHHGIQTILELSRFNMAHHSGLAKNSAPLLSPQLWVSCCLFTSHRTPLGHTGPPGLTLTINHFIGSGYQCHLSYPGHLLGLFSVKAPTHTGHAN